MRVKWIPFIKMLIIHSLLQGLRMPQSIVSQSEISSQLPQHYYLLKETIKKCYAQTYPDHGVDLLRHVVPVLLASVEMNPSNFKPNIGLLPNFHLKDVVLHHFAI